MKAIALVALIASASAVRVGDYFDRDIDPIN